MLRIFIDGSEAVLKKGSNIELVSENRRFSNSDSYTLDMSFPLKDCSRNIDIFGKIFRTDIMPEVLKFGCEIVSGKFRKSGSLIITEFSNTEVKGQFLEGRSGSDITSPLSEMYINEMSLTYPETDKSKVSVKQAWANNNWFNAVALPWVNDGTGNMQNKIVYSDDSYSWHEDCQGLSWQIYLVELIRRVVNQAGYEIEMDSLWNNPRYRYILVCNTLPFAWELHDFARALPHWTVQEFLENLELFLNGEFKIDHLEQSIVFRFYHEIESDTQPAYIDTAVNDFSAEVFVDDSECKFIEAVNIEFKSCSHSMWNFYSCDWYVKEARNSVKSYETLEAMLKDPTSWDPYANWGGYWKHPGMRKLFYAKDVDSYFCVRGLFPVENATAFYKFALTPVNGFGPRVVIEDKDAETKTIPVVPACVMETDQKYWWTMFLSMSGYSESDPQLESEDDKSKYRATADELSALTANKISSGEKGDVSEYFDRLYVGWWDGNIQEQGFNPFPNVSNFYISHDARSVKKMDFDLRLNSKNSAYGKSPYEIDTRIKYNIGFIGDEIPDVRAVFIISGKRYICEKLTATLTDSGLSKMIKGVFWRIKD